MAGKIFRISGMAADGRAAEPERVFRAKYDSKAISADFRRDDDT